MVVYEPNALPPVMPFFIGSRVRVLDSCSRSGLRGAIGIVQRTASEDAIHVRVPMQQCIRVRFGIENFRP